MSVVGIDGPIMKALVIDRYPLFAEAVGNVIRGLHVRAEIVERHSSEDARSCAEACVEFDLVVLDWDLPGIECMPLLKSIHRNNADALVVVVSAAADAESATRLIRGGAAGVILRSSPREAVMKALQLVLSGGIYFPAEAAASARVRAHSGPRRREFALEERQRRAVEDHGLSNREIEVLELLVAGHSNKVIGQRLNIAVCTVKAHITSILRSLNAASRTQAIYQVTHGDLAA